MAKDTPSMAKNKIKRCLKAVLIARALEAFVSSGRGDARTAREDIRFAWTELRQDR